MKLKIRGNSIRVRLGRSEVSRMIIADFLEEPRTFDDDLPAARSGRPDPRRQL
jgi:hypothetical protein